MNSGDLVEYNGQRYRLLSDPAKTNALSLVNPDVRLVTLDNQIIAHSDDVKPAQPTFEEKAIETLLLCVGNSVMALSEAWDRSDDGFEDQIIICEETLALANPELVKTTRDRLKAEGIPPFAEERDDPNACAECARSNGPWYTGECEHD